MIEGSAGETAPAWQASVGYADLGDEAGQAPASASGACASHGYTPPRPTPPRQPAIVVLFHAYGDLNKEIERVYIEYARMLERLKLVNGPWNWKGSRR